MNRETAIKILKGKLCPYCLEKPELVDSEIIYGKSYGNIWLCRNCGARVGVHTDTNEPLGRLADEELRTWKKKAHATFDLLWKQGHMKRDEAYKWLAEKLGINHEFCHIGMFSVKYCKKTVEVSTNKLQQTQ